MKFKNIVDKQTMKGKTKTSFIGHCKKLSGFPGK